MDHDVTTHALPHAKSHAGDEPHLTPRVYMAIWALLMVLLGVTVAVNEVDLGQWNFFIAFSIASIKAVLIMLFFMHVRYSPGLTRAVACAGFFWLAIMLSLTFADYLTRGWMGPNH